MDPTTILLTLAVVFGLYMAWAIGANDVANAMATSVGSGAISVKQAILIAGIFEFMGAFLAGGEVTSTIRKGIIDVAPLAGDPNVLVCGMLAALLAAAVWLTVASRCGWPVSTTHSIVGAIVGFAVVAIGIEAVHLGTLGAIAASWVISPVLAGTVSFILIVSVQRLIFDRENPERYARRYVPMYIFLTVLVISLVTFVKGLKHVGFELSQTEAFGYSFVFALLVMVIGIFRVRRLEKASEAAVEAFHYVDVERIFSVLTVITACAMAFAHGSNDVANAIGPLAAVITTVSTGEVFQEATVSPYILLAGGVGIVLGLATYGYRVMATVGTRITELTPSRGFAAGLAAASVVVLASGLLKNFPGIDGEWPRYRAGVDWLLRPVTSHQVRCVRNHDGRFRVQLRQWHDKRPDRDRS